MEQDNTKKYMIYLGLTALLVCAIVVLFGRMEFHNELEREVLPHTLIGYLNEKNNYFGAVAVYENEWPEWAEEFDYPKEGAVVFGYERRDARIGIFANLLYYENRYEKRSWFSGKLIERASEYYYKPEGNLYLEAVYPPYPEPEIKLEQIVPQSYDFMAYKGNETEIESR